MRDLTYDSTHLHVQNLTQMLLDNVLIETVQDVTRRWHSPERRVDQPVITKDRPWEHAVYFTYSNYCVLHDPHDGLFKCWYEDLEGPVVVPNVHFNRFSRVLYAESENGLDWRKPALDLQTFAGHKTNIILGDESYGQVHSASVVIDRHATSPDERFRMIYSHMWESSTDRTECAHSSDGIHWTVYDEPPQFGRTGSRLGDVHILGYDDDARQFILNTRHPWQMLALYPANQRTPWNARSFFRPYDPHNFAALNLRRVYQCRSHDFIHWTEPILVAAPDDEEDNLDESFYGMAQFKVGTIHFATVGLLHHVDDTMEVELLMSRDGVRWKRTNKRRPFLAPRGEGFWDTYMVSLTSVPVEVGNELWFFHGGANYHHDWSLAGAKGEVLDHPEARDPGGSRFGMGVATLRKDGFAGLYAGPLREGLVATRPLRSEGTRLVINARCGPSGYIKVEVVDGQDNVLANCSRDDCDAFTGDSVAYEVTWQGQATIPVPRSAQQGPTAQTLPMNPQYGPAPRRLRFFLSDAELFSFRFAHPGEG